MKTDTAWIEVGRRFGKILTGKGFIPTHINGEDLWFQWKKKSDLTDIEVSISGWEQKGKWRLVLYTDTFQVKAWVGMLDVVSMCAEVGNQLLDMPALEDARLVTPGICYDQHCDQVMCWTVRYRDTDNNFVKEVACDRHLVDTLPRQSKCQITYMGLEY